MSDIPSAGGKARAEKLTPERRKAIAEKAAAMRWAKPPTTPPASEIAKAVEGDVLPPSPFAKFRGQLDLGGNPIDVYVLDTGERVISMRGTVKAMTGQDAGNLVEYLSVQGLKDFIDKDLALVETRDFHIPGTQFRGRGITAASRAADFSPKSLDIWYFAADLRDRNANKGGLVMAISVLSAARELGRRSNWTLSNLELQKIIYLAHMFHLGRHAGAPLVTGNFEAWDYGPVHPELYHRAKIFGAEDVQDIFQTIGFPSDGEKAILDEAYDSLGHAGPGKLVSATHRHGGAWETYYIPGVRHCIIPNEAILAEYQALDAATDAIPG